MAPAFRAWVAPQRKSTCTPFLHMSRRSHTYHVVPTHVTSFPHMLRHSREGGNLAVHIQRELIGIPHHDNGAPKIQSSIIREPRCRAKFWLRFPPRSPIGYNEENDDVERNELRFPPDLPSGIIVGSRGNQMRQLRFPPDLPSGIMNWVATRRVHQLRFPPDLPSGIMKSMRSTASV